MNTHEIDAANALLDTRVRINVPAPRFLRLVGLKTWRFSLYRPVCAQLIRISRLYCHMDARTTDGCTQLTDIVSGKSEPDTGELLTLTARHMKDASRLVAYGMIRTGWATFLFHRTLARYLRTHSDARTLAELARMVVTFSGAENFTTIIRSIAHLTVTTPNLSQKKTES